MTGSQSQLSTPALATVFPRVGIVGRELEIALSGPTASPLVAGRTETLRLFSRVNRADKTDLTATVDATGVVRCRLRLANAGEYVLDVLADDGKTPRLTGALFAVSPELARYRPYKGDLHMHTTGSDGRDTGIDMARQSRRLGMDFIAITDHDVQASAMTTIPEADETGLDLLILPGEEVSIRVVGGHVLALNARAGIGPLRHAEETNTECDRLARKELNGRSLLPPLTPETYAHAVWTLNKIHELGGLAVMAHPYWVGTTRMYFPTPPLFEQLLRDELLDGLELMGGSATTEGNRLCIARWWEEAARGKPLPVTGGSDAHAVDELGSLWTILFAENLDAENVIDAIRAGRSVAVDQRTGAEAAIYGRFDFVEYAYFLHREYYPLHDAICRAHQPASTELEKLRAEFFPV